MKQILTIFINYIYIPPFSQGTLGTYMFLLILSSQGPCQGGQTEK